MYILYHISSLPFNGMKPNFVDKHLNPKQLGVGNIKDYIHLNLTPYVHMGSKLENHFNSTYPGTRWRQTIFR